MILLINNESEICVEDHNDLKLITLEYNTLRIGVKLYSLSLARSLYLVTENKTIGKC